MRRWLSLIFFLLIPTAAFAQQTRDITVGPSPGYRGKPLYSNSWAVLIGINQYQNPKIPGLSFAVNDVRAVKETLLRQGFPEGQILTLIDREATKKNIEVLLGDRLRRRVSREDRILIFFSGHGKDEEIRPNEYEGYLIPYDADPESLFGTSISMSALKQIGERIGAKHVLFAVDACYSGFAIFRGKSIINRELIEDLTRHPAIQVITAGRRGELAQEKDGQGLFTRAFIRALEGAADRRGWGWVSLEHVGEYVRDRVYADSNRGQYPQFGNLSGEGQFVFFRAALDPEAERRRLAEEERQIAERIARLQREQASLEEIRRQREIQERLRREREKVEEEERRRREAQERARREQDERQRREREQAQALRQQQERLAALKRQEEEAKKRLEEERAREERERRERERVAVGPPFRRQTGPLVYSIGWIFYGRDVGFVTAQGKGFYKEEGLDNFQMVRGFGGDDTMKKVAAGSYHLGGAVPPVSQLIAWKQGIKAKAVMMNHDIAPMVIWTLKDRGINSVKDLLGRSLGAPEGDAIWPNIKIMAALKGLDLAKIRHINVQADVRDALMLAGSYDASTGFITQYPILSQKAKQMGKEIHFVLLASEGLEVYGGSLPALDSTLKERGDDVRRFLRASLRGWAYAIEHPDEGMDHLLKICPVCDRTQNQGVWDITVDLSLTGAAKKLGLGAMTDAKWQKSIDFLAGPLKLTQKPSPSELYTNAYLPGIKPAKRGPRVAPVFQYPE